MNDIKQPGRIFGDGPLPETHPNYRIQQLILAVQERDNAQAFSEMVNESKGIKSPEELRDIFKQFLIRRLDIQVGVPSRIVDSFKAAQSASESLNEYVESELELFAALLEAFAKTIGVTTSHLKGEFRQVLLNRTIHWRKELFRLAAEGEKKRIRSNEPPRNQDETLGTEFTQALAHADGGSSISDKGNNWKGDFVLHSGILVSQQIRVHLRQLENEFQSKVEKLPNGELASFMDFCLPWLEASIGGLFAAVEDLHLFKASIVDLSNLVYDSFKNHEAAVKIMASCTTPVNPHFSQTPGLEQHAQVLQHSLEAWAEKAEERNRSEATHWRIQMATWIKRFRCVGAATPQT